VIRRDEMGDHVFEGKWACNYRALEDPAGIKSDFQLKHSSQSEEATSLFPWSASYSGWYKVKEPPDAKGKSRDRKQAEKDVYLVFEMNSENHHNVNGHGANQYGHYKIYGQLILDSPLSGKMEIYKKFTDSIPASKEKEVKPALPTEKAVTRGPLLSGNKAAADDSSYISSSTASRAAKTTLAREKSFSGFQPQSSSFKAGGGVMKAKPKAGGIPTLASTKKSPSMSGTIRKKPLTEMSEKITKGLKKMIQTMTRLGGEKSGWFMNPVTEAEAPGYTSIISYPMDFRTINDKLKEKTYQSAEEVGEDIMLIFDNAMTYNNAETAVSSISPRVVSAGMVCSLGDLMDVDNGWVLFSLIKMPFI